MTPTEVVKLLIALKGVYTFKSLSRYLKIPPQVIWRYTKYLNVPEKNTSRKILIEIEKNNLLYNALENVTNINRYGYIETWRINRNIHLLNLLSYLIYRYLKEKNAKINTVIPLSVDGIPLATVLSNWISAYLYIPYQEAYLTMDKWKSKEYIRSGDDKMRRIYLPRGIFKRGDNVLLTDLVLEDASIVNALYELIDGEDAIPWGIVVALSRSGLWLKDIEYPMEKKIILLLPSSYIKKKK